MLKEEFARLAEREFSNKEYGMIEKVYMYHPCISHSNGKEQLARLFDEFGIRIIADMYPAAEYCEELEGRIQKARLNLQVAQEEYERFRKSGSIREGEIWISL